MRSAFDLPLEQRAAIQRALEKSLSVEVQLRFETAPNLISGIALIKNGQKVVWSIDDYLTSLESGLGDLSNPPPAAAPTPENATEPTSIAESRSNGHFV